MSPWSAIASRDNLAGSDLSKSIATKRQSAPFRRSTATISWVATLSSTKPGHRVKAEEEAVQAGDADEEASAVVEAEAEVAEVVGEAEAVAEAEIAAIAVVAVEEIAAGNNSQRNQMKFITGGPCWLPGFYFAPCMSHKL